MSNAEIQLLPNVNSQSRHVLTAGLLIFILYNGASSKDSVGIQFPDGSTLGSTRNIKLRYVTTYMELAAQGKL